VARAAVREGTAVVVSGCRRGPGDALVAELRRRGEHSEYVPAGVADVACARASVSATVERFGRVDCLVNAAGLTSRGTLLDTTPELFDQHIAVNLRGPFFLMQAVVADMPRRGEGGTIVNVLSSSELGGQPYLAPYVAAEAGLRPRSPPG
jgi:NAD(P)-dependent dehydrogenase (short-subunit alcohol dehydrogenase family)